MKGDNHHKESEEGTRLRQLLQASTNVLSAKTVDDVLCRVVDDARELTGAGFASAAHGHIDSIFQSTATTGDIGRVGKNTLSEVFSRLLKSDSGSIRLTCLELEHQSIARPFPRGLIVAHLVGTDGRSEGMILVADKEKGEFNDEDETMLRQLATLTSLALQHIASRDEARVRAAEAEEGERILNALMNYIPEGIAIAEGAQVTIKMTSKYGQKMIGRHPKDMESIPARDQGTRWNLLRPDGSAVEPNSLPLARVSRRGELVINEELMLQQPDGTMVPVSCNSGPILDREGQIVGAVMAWRDITERKRAEDALLEANRRKDEFLALLAHELRNPLAPLINATQILKRRPEDAVKEKAFEVIERQVWHMVRLIDDLLDVSRITRGKIRLQKARVNLALIIESSVAASHPLMKERQHRFSVSYPEESIFIHADATRITQVIANLLNNAAKYTPKGGEVKLIADHQKGQAVIRVIDNGVGIPKESIPRLFHMFAQLDTTRDSSREGLGVGLALARELARMHGGTVTAHSEGIGQGSEFKIRLPILEEEEVEKVSVQPPKSEKPIEGERLKILVVDDSEDSARSLSTLLELMGHDVVAVHSGRQALDSIATRSPEVAVLDIGMPEMDGYELARKLRQRFPPQELLLVAVTGWGKDEDRMRAREAGFDHHLVKPAKPAELQQALTAFCQRCRQMREREEEL